VKNALPSDAWRIAQVLAKCLDALRLIWMVATAKVLIFGRPVHAWHLKAIRLARFFGKPVISDFCDYDVNIEPRYVELTQLSSLVTVPTVLLAKRVSAVAPTPVQIIEDSLDLEVLRSLPLNLDLETTNYNDVLWFGMAFTSEGVSPSYHIFCDIIRKSLPLLMTNKRQVTVVCDDPARAQTIFESLVGRDFLPIRMLKWNISVMQSCLSRPGTAIIPYEEPVENCYKSANRIELALYAGKRVVSNGMLKSIDESLQPWVDVVKNGVIQDHHLTDQFYGGQAGLSFVRHFLEAKQFNIHKDWKFVLESLLLPEKPASRPLQY